tara:strand:- start:63 stop:722 length:660 start_codon:yes stop_codon:yes gene_type:complete
MELNTHFIKTPKTARYSTYGRLSPKTKYFWFVIHGSNMLAEQMLYKFKEFDPETHFVLSPEGLSRFYVNGFGGKVVASWMTKRDRLEEIHDFSVYCSKLFDLYTHQLNSDCKSIIMGFSQGGVTALRWLHHLEVDVDFLIPYACWIPEDIDYGIAKTKWDQICKIFTYGKQDQFLNENKLDELIEICKQGNLDFNIEAYDGDHRVEKKQLKKIFKQYIK